MSIINLKRLNKYHKDNENEQIFVIKYKGDNLKDLRQSMLKYKCHNGYAISFYEIIKGNEDNLLRIEPKDEHKFFIKDDNWKILIKKRIRITILKIDDGKDDVIVMKKGVFVSNINLTDVMKIENIINTSSPKKEFK